MQLRLIPRPQEINFSNQKCRRFRNGLTLKEEYSQIGKDLLGPYYHGKVDGAHSPSLAIEVFGSPDSETYRLECLPAENGICRFEIAAAGPRAVIPAMHTLKQILAQLPETFFGFTIDDAPTFKNRGVMLDVSRDRVPRQEELYRIVDTLADFKYNHLQLYTEHTFAYLGHDIVSSEASPLTIDEIRALDEYCKLRGITLAANQNCLGHMERWLKHPTYSSLAETDSEWIWNGKVFPGLFSLCPVDPGSLALIDDLFSQLLPNFSSGIVNVGCDESHDVGQGRSREAVEERGAGVVYFDYVNQVMELARRRNFKPQFWADIALNHPEHLERIPQDATALVWNYEPDAPFSQWVELLKNAGRDAWVVPGTSSWRSITGRTTERRGNLLQAALARYHGAKGFMVADWGDDGHRQQWPITLFGLAEAAEFAWNGEMGNPDTEAISMFCFGDSLGWAAKWMAKLGDADLEIRQRAGKGPNGEPGPLRNATSLFMELHADPTAPPLPCTAQDWSKVVITLKELEESLPMVHDKQMHDEMKHALKVAMVAALKAIIQRKAKIKGITASDLQRMVREIIAEHRQLWLLRSRPGGLDDSCKHYMRVLAGLGNI